MLTTSICETNISISEPKIKKNKLTKYSNSILKAKEAMQKAK